LRSQKDVRHLRPAKPSPWRVEGVQPDPARRAMLRVADGIGMANQSRLMNGAIGPETRTSCRSRPCASSVTDPWYVMLVVMPESASARGRVRGSAAAIGPRPAFHEVPIGEHLSPGDLAVEFPFGLEPELVRVAMWTVALLPKVEGAVTDFDVRRSRFGGHALFPSRFGDRSYRGSHSAGVAGNTLSGMATTGVARRLRKPPWIRVAMA
jgi:hypothetical protein